MNPDSTFFVNMGVPDSTGVAHPKSYPFYVSETNPNPSGKCLCERPENEGPYVVFPGDMFDVSSPRPVLCAGCVGDCAAVLEGTPVSEVVELDPPVIELPPEAVVEDEVLGL
jgi:hypothetical protein